MFLPRLKAKVRQYVLNTDKKVFLIQSDVSKTCREGAEMPRLSCSQVPHVKSISLRACLIATAESCDLSDCVGFLISLAFY